MFLNLLMVCSFVLLEQVEQIITDTIWNTNNYSAFTSLVNGNGFYYCAFREATSHRSEINDISTWGRIIILCSSDKKEWNLYSLIKEDSADLRDPKLSFTPEGELQLLYCLRMVKADKLGPPITCCIRWNKDGESSKEYIKVKDYFGNRQWLWGVNWHDGIAYGFMYGSDFLLLSSVDGVNFEVVSILKPFGETPSEAIIVFRNDTAIAVARSKGNDGLLGKAVYPYKEWGWKRMSIKLGGPSLALLSNGKLLLGSRNYQDEMGKTSLYIIDNENVEKLVTLPSTSDSSYPSFVVDGNHVYVSYYTGVKGKTCIIFSDLIIN